LDIEQRKALLGEISELVALSLPDEPDDLERQEQELEELIAKSQRRQGLIATPPKDEQPPQEELPPKDEQQTQELIAPSLSSDECVPTDYDPNIFGDPQETFIPDDWQTPSEVQEQQTQELEATDDPQETYIPDDWQTPDDAYSDMAFAMCETQTDETNLHFT
ncbi:hypothetical protein, partial [Helicobacter suis]|uniref:hypothetical protein n=1 Tax=Helicobacter suis TaxID=104628 RepID=UPI0013151086